MSNNKDYQDFLNREESSLPTSFKSTLLENIKEKMNPSHTTIFLKLILVQAFIGTITMAFCPQFEMSLTNKYELFHFFHRNFGHYGCMAACGCLFIGSGSIFAGFLLSAEEIFKIKSSRFLYYFSVSGIAVLSFLLIGADIYLEVALAWGSGALLGGIIFLEVSSFSRYKLMRLV